MNRICSIEPNQVLQFIPGEWPATGKPCHRLALTRLPLNSRAGYMEEKFSLYVMEPGSRPQFPAVAHYVWGMETIDSDDSSRQPNDNHWTELTIIRCSTNSERLDIGPVSDIHWH